LQTIYEIAKSDPNILYVGSDVGYKTLADFKQDLPDQYFVEGISEAYVIGMAAGLAMSGKKPYVNTIATFLSRRCYEQLAVDVCLGNYDVRLYANGGGLVYASLGPTHLAIEDIALMRALPNMTVIVPTDADEMERAVRASKDYSGPIYFRVARGGDPLVNQKDFDFEIGKANVLRKPGQLLFIATGIMVHKALQVAQILETEEIQAGVVNVHTLKPLDEVTLTSLLEMVPNVIALEEHSLIGGLGSAVSQLMAEKVINKPLQFKQLGIPDCFPDKYGRQEDLLEYYGLDNESILTVARKMLS
jgi:transketolase